MASKTKIALVLAALLGILILISPKVAMAARSFEEGELYSFCLIQGYLKVRDFFKQMVS